MKEEKSIRIPISGMHCRSCELLIEEEIRKVEGVTKVLVNQKKGEARVWFLNTAPTPVALERAVTTAGYSVGEGKKRPLFSTNINDYLELFLGAGSLFIVYAALVAFGVFDQSFAFGETPSFGVVTLIGLIAGVSSCMALIGGLVLAVSSAHAKKHPEATARERIRPHAFFNAGRIIGFALLGGVVGSIGSVFRLSSGVLGWFIVAVGVVMFVLGVKLLGIFPRLEGVSVALPKWVSRIFGIRKEVREYSHRGAFLTGALTFFLPCGFTQAMQLYAMSTGSFTRGAFIMALFAVGTAPGLLGIGALASFAKGSWGRVFFKASGALVLAFAFLNVQSGLNLTGVVAPFAGTPDQAVAEVSEGVQTIYMTQKSNGYVPNRFTIKKGVPVRWVITSENPYTCAAYLAIPAYDLFFTLEQGENVVSFTPTKTGQLRFSCSMGMYSGVFTVVD